MTKSKSLKKILVRKYVLLAVVPLLLLNLAFILFYRTWSVRTIIRENMNVARLVASELEDNMSQPIQVLSQAANIIESETIVGAAEADEFLKSQVEAYNYFESILVIDGQGKVRHAGLSSRVKGKPEDYRNMDLSRVRFFRNSAGAKKPLWSAPFFSVAGGGLTVTLTIPCKKGILAGNLNLHILRDISDRVSSGSGMAVYVVDRNGTMIAHSQDRLSGDLYDLSSLNIVQEGLSGKSGTYRYDSWGTRKLGSVVTIPVTGWLVIAEQQEGDAYRELWYAEAIFFFGLLITLALALAAAHRSIKNILDPLTLLISGAERITKGHYGTPPFPVGYKEVEDLAAHFREMAFAVSQRETELRDRNEELVLTEEMLRQQVKEYELSQAALSQTNRTLHALIEAAPLAVVVLDPASSITMWNSAAERMFGWSKGEILGKPYPLVPRGEEDECSKMRSRVMSGYSYSGREVRRLHKDGSLIDVALSAAPICNADSQAVGAIAIMEDITERKKAEEELRESNRIKALLSGSIFNTPLGMILWKVDGGEIAIVDWNSSAGKIFGWSREEVVGRNFLGFIPAEEDMPQVQEVVSLLLENRYPRNLQHKCRTKNGGSVLIAWFNTVATESDGTTYVLSLAEDVTERNLAEEQLRRSRQEIHLILESISDAFVAVDREWRFTYVNAKAEQLLRRGPGTLFGKIVWDVFPEAVSTTFYEKFQQAYAEQTPIHFEDYYPPLDIWVETRIYPYLEGLSCFIRDINDRKKAEKALAWHARSLEKLLSASHEFTTTTESEMLCHKVVAIAKDLLDLDFSTIMLFNEDRTHLVIKGTVGFPAGFIGTFSLASGEGLATQVAQSRSPDVVVDFRCETRFLIPPAVDEYGITSAVCVPMMLYEEVFGVLIGHCRSRRNFSDDEISVYQSLANQAAVAIRNSLTLYALKESEKKYRDLFEQANDAIFIVDEDLRYRDVNRKACEMLGYGREELLQMRIPDLLPPIQLARSGREFAKIRGGSSYEQFHGQTRRKDGSYIHVEVSGSPIMENGRVIGSRDILRDITDRVRVENELRDLSSRLNALMTHLHAGILFEDNSRRIIYANPEFCRIFSIDDPPEALVGFDCRLAAKTVSTMFEETELFQEGIDAALAGGVPALNEEWILKDGRTLERDYIPVVVDDIISGHLWHYRDISERKRIEEEIRRLNVELEQRVLDRTAQLEAANRELEAFSYSVSHDLRAPLRHINGFSSALLDDYKERLDEQGEYYIDRLVAVSRHMGELIDDLLKLSRVSRSELAFADIDLSSLARAVCADLHQLNPGRAVEVVIQEDVFCRGDFHLMRAVLENLFGNAWKYTGRQEQAKIEFGMTGEAGKEAYFIRDNGVGFDMAYSDKLFGAFQRLHRPDEFEGTGIGLATVQRIIQRHGGRIWAEGEVGRGAAFFFTLGSE